MNAYNLLQPHQKKRLEQLQSTPLGKARAKWFLQACLSGSGQNLETQTATDAELKAKAIKAIQQHGKLCVKHFMILAQIKESKAHNILMQLVDAQQLSRYKRAGVHSPFYYVPFDPAIPTEIPSAREQILKQLKDGPMPKRELLQAVGCSLSWFEKSTKLLERQKLISIDRKNSPIYYSLVEKKC